MCVYASFLPAQKLCKQCAIFIFCEKQLPMYEVIGSHEAIIDEATFQAVQDEIEKRKKYTPKNDTTKRYLFSGLIHCAECGSYYGRKIATSGPKYSKVVWICSTYNRLGKEYCSSQRIPENILIEITKNVLGLESIDGINLKDYLKRITVTGHGGLHFTLIDGTTKDVTWQNRSRRESWTPEMKEKARQRALKNSKERSAKNGDHQQN